MDGEGPRHEDTYSILTRDTHYFVGLDGGKGLVWGESASARISIGVAENCWEVGTLPPRHLAATLPATFLL